MSRNRSTRRSGSPWPWRRGKRVDPLRRLEQFNVATGSPQPDGRSTRRRATGRRLAFWARARPAQPDATASTPPPEEQRRSSRSTRKGVQPAAAPPPTPPPVRTRRRAVAPPAPAAAAAPTSAEPSGRRSRRAAASEERARKKAERAQESERAKEAERVRKEEERVRREAARAQELERAKEAARTKEAERVREEQEALQAKEAERVRKEQERARKEAEALRAKEEAELAKAEERARRVGERVRKEEEAARAKEVERARKEAEALQAKEEAERAKADAARAKADAERAKEEERARKEAEAARVKEDAERAKEEERARKEAEAARVKEDAERAKEEERARKEAEAARVKEEAERAKEEERARKEEERARKDEERASRKRNRTRGRRRARTRAGASRAAAPVASAATVATLTPELAAPKRRKRRRFRRRARQEQMELGIATSAPQPPRRRPRTEQPGPDLLPAAAVSTAPDDARAEQLVLVSADEKEANLTAPSTITNADLVNEAVAGLFSRPTRTILTVLGTMIGLTALVATLGLSRTANSRIAGRFDEIAATEVVVAPRPVDITAQNNDLPWDAGQRLRRLNGVVAAGTLSKVDVGNALVTASPVKEPGKRTDFKLSVQAASPSLFSAVRAQLGTGRLPDEGHSRRHERVAVLGRNAADDLGIGDLARLPAISIGADTFLVIGIVDSVARQERLLSSVMIPEGTARELYRLQRPDLAVIETAIGANALIADQAPIALRPDNAEGLKVTQQAELRQVRENVTGDLDLLFLMLGGVSLLVGAIGIANVTLVSVMERTGEIGLRRALGATRRHIARQFLLESTAMGFVGGILGASLGILIVVAVSALQGWSPVLDPLTPFAAPVIGGVIGLVAGSYPAHRAASLEPVEALRAGT